MNLKHPFVHGYWMEPSEIVGVVCTLFGKDAKACAFNAPASYVPFGIFLRDQKDNGVQDAWIVNTSIEGTHWVMVIVDIQPDAKRMWIVEPLAPNTPYTLKMAQFIKETVPDIAIKTLWLGLQVNFSFNLIDKTSMSYLYFTENVIGT
jgi:hypothetical protein